ncbi:hypothetical protein FOA52_001256 [Chlamydomonas sp. UWO 241]|nr:hypothetical protein FOA52_001256 [Chlamydomonas sp. UWO 241]
MGRTRSFQALPESRAHASAVSQPPPRLGADAKGNINVKVTRLSDNNGHPLGPASPHSVGPHPGMKPDQRPPLQRDLSRGSLPASPHAAAAEGRHQHPADRKISTPAPLSVPAYPPGPARGLTPPSPLGPGAHASPGAVPRRSPVATSGGVGGGLLTPTGAGAGHAGSGRPREHVKGGLQAGDALKRSTSGAGAGALGGMAGKAMFTASAGADLGQRLSRANVSSSSNNNSGMRDALSQTMPASQTASSPPSRGARAVTPGGSEQEHVVGDVVAAYGAASLQGMRNYQEDRIGFDAQPGSLSSGVFDGHGGDAVSIELERVLLPVVLRAMMDGAAGVPDAKGAVSNAMAGAIKSAFVRTNEDMAKRLPASQDAGSCASVAVIVRAQGVVHLFCANVGDCRAVLYTSAYGPPGQKRAVRLSEDHKPHPQVCPAEITRVTNAGGCVLWGRVQGCLAVSRAFGDRALHPFVIAEPYISVRPVNPDQDAFLYIASDGVTDVIDDTAGCQIVADCLARGQSSEKAALALCNAAFQQGSSDNISAIVIRLRRR